MAAELPISQQVLRATVNARSLHSSKLTPSEAEWRMPNICWSEKLICSAAGVPNPPATWVLCYDCSFETNQESVCVRSYFAQRTEAGQNQGNHRARRRSRYLSRTVHAHRRICCSGGGSRLWRVAGFM